MLLVQAQRPRHARGQREGALGGVVESFGPHGRDVAQAALHLVGNGQGGQEVSAAATRVLGRRQHRPRLSLGWQVSPGAR